MSQGRALPQEVCNSIEYRRASHPEHQLWVSVALVSPLGVSNEGQGGQGFHKRLLVLLICLPLSRNY